MDGPSELTCKEPCRVGVRRPVHAHTAEDTGAQSGYHPAVCSLPAGWAPRGSSMNQPHVAARQGMGTAYSI
jgi:hypothetical protein